MTENVFNSTLDSEVEQRIAKVENERLEKLEQAWWFFFKKKLFLAEEDFISKDEFKV
jgi:hypothetical protein